MTLPYGVMQISQNLQGIFIIVLTTISAFDSMNQILWSDMDKRKRNKINKISKKLSNENGTWHDNQNEFWNWLVPD